jgi:hypothetical protein
MMSHESGDSSSLGKVKKLRPIDVTGDALQGALHFFGEGRPAKP